MSAPPRRRGWRWSAQALLVAALSWLAVEATARVVLSDPGRLRTIGNDTPTGRRLIAQANADRFGDALEGAMGGRLAWHEAWGWTNRPGVHVRTGVTTTISAAGHRVVSPPTTPEPPPALVLAGDSFTYGDEVDDHQTWAWGLAAALGAPVQNQAALGYGLDQIWLRLRDTSPPPPVALVHLNSLELLRVGLAWDAWRKPVVELDALGRIAPVSPVPTVAEARGEVRWSRTGDVIAMWRERATGPIRAPEQLAPIVGALLDALRTTAPVVIFVWQPLIEELPGPDGRPRSATLPMVRAWAAARGVELVDETPWLQALVADGVELRRGAHWTPEVHARLAGHLAEVASPAIAAPAPP